DAIHGRQPQTGAFRLRGEEGLEDLELCFRAHAGAGVTDGDLHVLTWCEIEAACGVDLVQVHGGGGDRDAARAAYRVTRIDDEVHDDLLELAGIDEHVRHIVEDRIERDVRTDQATQELLDVRD